MIIYIYVNVYIYIHLEIYIVYLDNIYIYIHTYTPGNMFVSSSLASTARDISSRADGMQAQTKDCPSARTNASSGAMTVVLPSPIILGTPGMVR
jgi:hypothetical protein